MFKTWSIGDLVRSDAFDGNTVYNVIEAFDTNDRVNKKDLARPIRNAFENQKDLSEFTESWAYYTSMNNGVIKDALISEFTFRGDSDVIKTTINPGTGDTDIFYLRLTPGVAMNNHKIAVNRPQTHIAERQLNEIFNLESWGTEGTEIKYYYNVDLFQARIKKNDINGNTVNHDFLNGGTWGDSDGGYNSGVALLEAIYDDLTYFRNDFADAVGVDLTQIDLETNIMVDVGDTYYWFIDRNGLFIGDTVGGTGDSRDLSLYTVSIAAGGDSSDSWIDQRTYIQNFNDFSTYMFLNVPQEWGDTRSELLTVTDGDTNLDYADITNQDTFLIFLRKSSGDTQDNSLFGWAESTIPGIDETRTLKFFANKDILSRWSIDGGDTLGASWASIKEMSGDSWTFYGNKTFKNGFYEFDVTDITPDSFKIDTLGGIDLDVDEGFTLHENSGALFTIDTNGAIVLTSASNQDIDITAAGTGNISFTAAGDSINFTAAAFGISVTDHFLTAGGDIGFITGDSFFVNSTGGIYLRENSGGQIDIETDGTINIDSPNAMDINLTAGSSESDADINLTAYRNVNITAAGDSISFTAATVDFNLTYNFDIDATDQISYDSAKAAVDAIKFNASNAAGGIDFDSGTNGMTFDTTGDLSIAAIQDINITGDTLTLNMVGLINIDADDITLDASGAYIGLTTAGRIDIDATSGQLVDITSDTEVQINGGVLIDLDATTITMDGTTLDLNMALDLDTTGLINLTTTNIGAAAIRLFANGGGIDIDVTDEFNVNAGPSSSIISIANATASSIIIDANGAGATTAITANTNITLTAENAGNITLTATGDDVIVNSSIFDCNSTSQLFNGTTFTVDMAGAGSIATNTGLTLSDDGGASVTLQNAGDIDITTVNTGDDITLTSAGDIDLIAAGDTILLSSYTLDINATTIQINGTITGTTVKDEDTMSSNSNIHLSTQQSIKAYVDAQVTAQDLDITTNSGTIAIDLDSETLSIVGGEGIDTSAVTNTITITGELASTTNKGVASFNSTDFAVSSGVVTLNKDPVITLGGDLSGNVTLTNLGSATLTATIVTNAVALGSNTTGAYTSYLTAGTGVTLTGTNNVETAVPIINIGQAVGVTNTVRFGAIYIGTASPAYLLGDSTDVSGWTGTAGTAGINCGGSFAAYKLYNATWNDYAEGFEFDPSTEYPEPGFVYKQTENGVVKTNKKTDKGTIGVYSDTAGMVMGSLDCIIPELIGTDEDQSKKTKVPLAMAGKVRVWIKRKLEIGDLLIASKNGFATKANFIDKIFKQDSIIGKVLESSCCKLEKRIWMLVK